MVPEKYIAQLIEDMVAAHKKPKDKLSDNTSTLNDINDGVAAHFQEVENYLEFDNELEPKFGEIIELEAIRFPKAELLTEDQMLRILSAFYHLLSTYNISIDLPEELPVHMEYLIAVQILDEAIFLSEEGHVGWDVCTYESESCPLGEYCTCLAEDRAYELNIQDARQLLDDMILSCQELIQEFGHMEIKIGNTSKDTFSKVCMFIAGGSDFVPLEIYQFALNLQDACDLLQQIFQNDPDIASLFGDLEKKKVHRNLEVFLSLTVEKLEENTFHVEPYHVEDGRIYKGPARSYTPEELMEKLEADDEKENY